MPGESEVANAGGTARDAFLGYTYQAEVGLLELTRRRVASADPEWSLTIEAFDDVAFERDTSPEEFLQTKHSRSAASSSRTSANQRAAVSVSRA
jgi:hypothetical protein